MTIKEAKRIVNNYEYKSVLTEDEAFLLTEAMEFLIEETKDTDWMVRLGGYYYEQKDFDLALKYYEMADSYGDKWAAEGLGYIWYYGRTGEKDYEKAFKCFEKAAENGQLRSAMKVADMYKNGYYVEKDYDRYCSMVEDLYKKVQYSGQWDVWNDIAIRLGRIRKEQGKTEEAEELFMEARRYLVSKLSYNPFFGDLNVMKWLTEDLYEIREFDRADFDLYDLYYLLREPVTVGFRYHDKDYTVEAVQEPESVSVHFDGKWYKDVSDFFLKAEIDGDRLPVLYYELSAFRVM